MPTCSVKGCKNRAGRNRLGEPVHFFTFPKNDGELILKWMKACNRDYVNLNHARVCSIHFKPECYRRSPKVFRTDYTKNGRFNGRIRVLHDSAIPTENLDYELLRQCKNSLPRIYDKEKISVKIINTSKKPILTKTDSTNIQTQENKFQFKQNVRTIPLTLEAHSSVQPVMNCEINDKIEVNKDNVESTPVQDITFCKASEMQFDMESPDCNIIELESDQKSDDEHDPEEETIIMYTPDNHNIKLVTKKSDQLRLQEEIIKNLHIKLEEREKENDKLRRKVELLEDVLKIYIYKNGHLKSRVSKATTS